MSIGTFTMGHSDRFSVASDAREIHTVHCSQSCGRRNLENLLKKKSKRHFSTVVLTEPTDLTTKNAPNGLGSPK